LVDVAAESYQIVLLQTSSSYIIIYFSWA